MWVALILQAFLGYSLLVFFLCVDPGGVARRPTFMGLLESDYSPTTTTATGPPQPTICYTFLRGGEVFVF